MGLISNNDITYLLIVQGYLAEMRWYPKTLHATVLPESHGRGTSKLHCRTNSRLFGWIAVFTLDAPWHGEWIKSNIFAYSKFCLIWSSNRLSLIITSNCVVLTIIIGYCMAFAFTFNCIWDMTWYDILFHVRVYLNLNLHHHISCTFTFVISYNFNIQHVFLSRWGKCIQLLTRLIHGPLLNLQRLDISGVYVSIGDSWQPESYRLCAMGDSNRKINIEINWIQFSDGSACYDSTIGVW